MHILMAAVEGLGVPINDIVLNRTSLRKLREDNRHHQFGQAKTEFIDNVIYSDLGSYASIFLSCSTFLLFAFLFFPVV